jgi:hypothetical protein
MSNPREEFRHLAASVQIVEDSLTNYRIEMCGAGADAQNAAERIFGWLKRM